MLGDVELRAGHADESIAAFDAALRVDPSSALSQSALARALAQSGRDLDRALDLARRARESDPMNADFAEALGRVLHAKGLYAAAVDQLRAAIDLLPHPIASYRYRLGLSLLAAGEREAAARELTAALAIDPTFEEAPEAKRLVAELKTTKPGA
jgi:tetratricopeptide (TPR) repeat protein